MAYNPYNTPDIFAQQIPTEDEADVLSWLKNTSIGALGFLGNVLDTPGSLVRGIAAGEPTRAITGIFNPEDRVTGKELFGIEDSPDAWSDDIGGIGAEILLDPLTYLTMGASAAGKAGKIAKLAGLMPKAERVGAQLVKGAAELGTTTTLRDLASKSPKALQSILKVAEGQSKPGLIKRGIESVTGHTFDRPDLVGDINKGLSAASGAGGLVDEPLRAGVARLSVPFTDIGVNIGDTIAPQVDQFTEGFRFGNWLDVLPDRAQQMMAEVGIKDINPIRTLAPYFQKSSLGGGNKIRQILGQSATENVADLERAGRETNIPLVRDWLDIPDSMDNPQVMRALYDYVETGGDASYLNGLVPQQFAEQWRLAHGPNIRASELDTGVHVPFENNYLFGQTREIPGYENKQYDIGNSLAHNPAHGSQKSKQDIFQGNRESQLSQMSLDDFIVMQGLNPKDVTERIINNYGFGGFNPADLHASTDLQFALQSAPAGSPGHAAIKTQLDALDSVTPGIAEAGDRVIRLADYMQNSVGPRYLNENARLGITDPAMMFGLRDVNPIEKMGERLNRSARLVGEANAIQDNLYPHIQDIPAGGNPDLVPLDKALVELKFGIDDKPTQQIIDNLSKKIGKSIDPKNASIPKEIFDDFIRVRKAFSAPEEVEGFWKAIDKATTFFKTFALTRPAFHVRNMVSGQVQNAMNGLWSPYSTQVASKLMAGQEIKGLAKWLGVNMSDADAARWIADQAFVENIIPHYAGQVSDIPNVANNQVAGAIPGVNPVGDPLTAQTAKQYGKNVVDIAKNPLDSLKRLKEWAKDKYASGQLNPLNTRGIRGEESKFVVSQAQEKASHLIEGYNRLGAFIEGLRKGIDPKELAQQIRNMQVDYGNLSRWEQSVARRAMPFYCVPDDCELLSNNGWKTVDELNAGDIALTMNHEDGSMKWEAIQAINLFAFDGELLAFGKNSKGHIREFAFTEDHRWPVISRERDLKNNLSNGTAVIYRVGGIRKFKQGKHLNCEDRIPCAGNFDNFPEESILSPRLAAILGWVVTDGYHRWRGEHCEMLVYQSPSKHLDEIITLLGTIPRKPHPDTGVMCVPVAIADVKEITKYFKSKKDMSWIVTRLSREAFDAMWNAMMNAESANCQTVDREFFCQEGEQVRDAFQIMCMLNGITANLCKRGMTLKQLKHYQISNKLKRIAYKGRVWCPTTPSGTWVMRRNGCVVITGNSFQKGMVPFVAGELATNPGGPYGQLLRGMNRLHGDGEILPDHIKNSLAIPLGENEQGDSRYITGLGLMPEDSYSILGSALGGGGLWNKVGETLNPALKWPIEQMTGRSLFQGRELEDLDPVLGRIGANIFGGEPANTRSIDNLLMNSIPSPFTMLKSATDPRKGIGAKALNTLTGVKVSDVPEKTQEALARELLQKYLRTVGGREYTKYFVPDDQLAKLSPEEQQKARVIQSLLKELSERAKQRAKK